MHLVSIWPTYPYQVRPSRELFVPHPIHFCTEVLWTHALSGRLATAPYYFPTLRTAAHLFWTASVKRESSTSWIYAQSFWANSSFLTRWKIEPSKSEKLTLQLSFDARGTESFPKNKGSKMCPTAQHSHLLLSIMFLLQHVSYIPSGRHGDCRQRSCWCVAWESHEPCRNGSAR